MRIGSKLPGGRAPRARLVAVVACAAAVPAAAAVLAAPGPEPHASGASAARTARGDPLPARTSRPTLVQPEAGVVGGLAATPESGGPAVEGAAAPDGGRDISPGAPSDAEIRAELDALEREQARVERLILNSSAPIRPGSGRLIWPVSGPVTSPFGPRWGRLHAGIDIAAPTGTAIRAADTGQVVVAGWVGGYGNYTCIRHTGALSTCYGHQSRILVRTGQTVVQGAVVGAVGCTGHCFGSHLHFETRIDGRPVDPLRFL
jgi:murein DD-endopeptidase MepM/ murein hydrolase activator NlpD